MNVPVLTMAHAMWALAIGSAYAAWSIVGKSLHLTGPWVTIIVLIGTAVGGLGMAYNDAKTEASPTFTAISILFIVSLLNGIGVYLQATKVVDVKIPTVNFIMTIIVTMVVMTSLFNWALNGEALSPRQWIGVGATIATIFILVG